MARLMFGFNSRAARRFSQTDFIVVVTYHRVGDAQQLWPDPVEMAEATVAQFNAQMDWIRAHCNPVTVDDVLQVIQGKGAFPNRAVLVTFDDGYREDLQRVLPALRRNDIRPVVFLPTAYVGTRLRFWWDRVGVCLQTTARERLTMDELGGVDLSLATERDKLQAIEQLLDRVRPLDPAGKERFLGRLEQTLELGDTREADQPQVVSWDEVQQLTRQMDFGAHTETHPVLSSLSADQARAEMAGSKAAIEQRLGLECATFAIPYGDAAAYTSESLKVASQVGFSLVFTLQETVRNLRWLGGTAIMDRMTFDQADGVEGVAAKITFPRIFIPDWTGRAVTLARKVLPF